SPRKPPRARPRRCVPMRKHSAIHLTDSQVLEKLLKRVVHGWRNEAEILVLIAEADFRKLYLTQGYTSMKDFCEEVLHFTEDEAFRRIQAARKAREFPELFDALADGRLHLTAIGLLAPHLDLENAAELIGAATHRRKSEIKDWLDRRFPVPQ